MRDALTGEERRLLVEALGIQRNLIETGTATWSAADVSNMDAETRRTLRLAVNGLDLGQMTLIRAIVELRTRLEADTVSETTHNERAGQAEARLHVIEAVLRRCRPHVQMATSITSGRDFREAVERLLHDIDAVLSSAPLTTSTEEKP